MLGMTGKGRELVTPDDRGRMLVAQGDGVAGGAAAARRPVSRARSWPLLAFLSSARRCRGSARPAFPCVMLRSEATKHLLWGPGEGREKILRFAQDDIVPPLSS